MKELTLLATPDEVAAYVRGLWRTDHFQASPYVEAWVQRFAAEPRIFADMSDQELEYPHFATWFGMTYRRTYAEATVSDLYYLHELVHAAHLTYRPEPLFTAWYRKMNGIELTASLETECYVYLSVEGLRDVSFKDEIWVDRFFGGKSRLGDSLRDVIRQERYRAMRDPAPMDYSEQQIAAYARQNFEWANIWKLETARGRPAFVEVEEHMSAHRSGALSLDEHAAWLTGMGEVPFRDQARLFAPVYWNSKLSYRLRKLT